MATPKEKREYAAYFAKKISKDPNILVSPYEFLKNSGMRTNTYGLFKRPLGSQEKYNLWCAGFVSAIAAYTDRHFGENNRLFDSGGANSGGKLWSRNVRDAVPGVAVTWLIRPVGASDCRNGGHVALVVDVDKNGIWTVGGNERCSGGFSSTGNNICGPKHIKWESVELRQRSDTCPSIFNGYRLIWAEDDESLRNGIINPQPVADDGSPINDMNRGAGAGAGYNPAAEPEINWRTFMEFIGSSNKIQSVNTDALNIDKSKSTSESTTTKNPEIINISKPTIKKDKLEIDMFENNK